MMREEIAVLGSIAAVVLIVAWLTPASIEQAFIGGAVALGIWVGVTKLGQASWAKIVLMLAIGVGLVSLPILFGYHLDMAHYSLGRKFMVVGGTLIVAGLVALGKKTLSSFFSRD